MLLSQGVVLALNTKKVEMLYIKTILGQSLVPDIALIQLRIGHTRLTFGHLLWNTYM